MVKPICSEPLSAAASGIFAHLDVARDVLDHHDGIVDDEAGRDGERHQGEIVKAVSQQVHDAEGAHQRQWDRYAGNDGGGEAAQEEEDHHHDQGNGEHQFELHIVHRGADGLGAVSKDLDLDGGRQAHLELRQHGFDAVDHRDNVRARLALYVHNDGRRAVHPRGLHRVLRAVDDIRHIGHAHRRAIAVGDDNGFVAGGGQQLVVGSDRVGLTCAVQVALRRVHIRGTHRRAQVFHADAVGSKLRRVCLNAHCGLLATCDGHQTNAGDLRDLLRHVGVGQVLDLLQGHSVGG